MGIPHLSPAPMTIDEFFALTETRPDEEKWELIDGDPVLNASPSYGHQKIVLNLAFWLENVARREPTGWEVVPGLGLRLSEIRSPEPDVLVRPRGILRGSICDDAIVAFEVLSPSTADRDLRWKRRAYAELPSLAHYVVLAQDAVETVSFDRAQGWQERRLEGTGAALDLFALGISVPLRELYRGTGLDRSTS